MRTQHKKLAIIGMLVSIGLAGAMGCAVDEPKADDEQVADTELAVSGSIVFSTYFNNAAHDVVIGKCVFNNCPGTVKGTRCQGTTSEFVEREKDDCNADLP